MNLRLSLAAAAAFLLPAVVYAQSTAPDAAANDAFQINYVSNLNIGDGVVNVTNAGSSAGTVTPVVGAGTAGDICVNIYVYAPDQEQATCCSCYLTPNSLFSWPVSYGSGNLLANVTNGSVLANIANSNHSVVLKLLATAPVGGTCNPAAPGTALEPGLAAWATHAHPTNTVQAAITETQFINKNLSVGEYNKLTGECYNNLHGGSQTQCPSCRIGGLAAPAPSL